jgi:hypothetical protein
MIAAVFKEDMSVAIGSESYPHVMLLLISRQVTYLFRTTGQVLGVSLSGAVFQAILLQKLRERIQDPDLSEAR